LAEFANFCILVHGYVVGGLGQSCRHSDTATARKIKIGRWQIRCPRLSEEDEAIRRFCIV